MNNKKYSFIIFAPPYNETSGGIVVLYHLHKLLSEQGYKSQIYLIGGRKERILYNNAVQIWWKQIILCAKRVIVEMVYFFQKKEILLNDKKTATEKYLSKLKLKPCINKNTIVIYPEIEGGNPLRANNVVRWFLYKSGVYTNRVDYGKNDLFFCYDKAFNDPKLNPDENLLNLLCVKREIFKQTNFEPRSGNCYIVRKGEMRDDLPKSFDGPVIDGLSDEEIAKIFNQSEYCISYDPYTFYTTYAALCDCIPVIMPLQGVKKDDWLPKKEMQYGIAYGMTAEEIQFAKDTKNKKEVYLDSIEQESVKQVQNFVSVCAKHFKQP